MANLNYKVLTLNKEWNNSFTIFNKIIFSSHERNKNEKVQICQKVEKAPG